ncbi:MULTISPECIES: PAS domain S-box protein [Halomonas]|uniref:PAS domain S-box protein n=1 Tax=Halomonas tibetensis TaxID=2259590 RepID=A0ABV7B320_9GAMM
MPALRKRLVPGYLIIGIALVAVGLLVTAVLVDSRLLGAGLLVAALALIGLAAWQWQRLMRDSVSPVDSAHLQTRLGERRFRAMLESLPNIAVQGYDRQRRVVFWNEESERLYGYRYEEVRGRRLESLIIPEAMRKKVIRDHEAWLQEGRAIPPARLELRDRDGQPVPVYSYHVMLDEHTAEPVMFCVDVRLAPSSSLSR